MVGTKAVLISCVIDAQEHRDVATVDMSNAFIQTRVEKIEYMATIIVQRTLVDVLVEIAPDINGPYVSTDKKGVKTDPQIPYCYLWNHGSKSTILQKISARR